MPAQRVNPPSLPTPMAAYSQVVRTGDVVTTAGMVALDAEGDVVGAGDIAAQTRQTLENLKTALESVGASLADVIKTTVFISDFAGYAAMNAVYDEYFQAAPPARSTVGATLVLPSLLVEIEAVAVTGASEG